MVLEPYRMGTTIIELNILHGTRTFSTWNFFRLILLYLKCSITMSIDEIYFLPHKGERLENLFWSGKTNSILNSIIFDKKKCVSEKLIRRTTYSFSGDVTYSFVYGNHRYVRYRRIGPIVACSTCSIPIENIPDRSTLSQKKKK